MRLSTCPAVPETEDGFRGDETVLELSGKLKTVESKVQVATEIKNNRALTRVDISDNYLGKCDQLPDGWQLKTDSEWNYELKDGRTLPYGYRGQDEPPANSASTVIVALSAALCTNDTLTYLDLSHNRLGERMLPEGWVHSWVKDYEGNYECAIGMTEYGYTYMVDGTRQTEDPGTTPYGITQLAKAISTTGALQTLIVRKNGLLHRKAGAALASMLATNTVLTELDVSDNDFYDEEDDGFGFALEIVGGLATNRTLVSLNLGHINLSNYGEYNDDVYTRHGHLLANAFSANNGLKELDLTFNFLRMSFLREFSTCLRTHRTLETLRIGANNYIYTAEGARLLNEIIADNPVLTELDISGIRKVIPTTCDASFFETFANGLRINTTLKRLDLSSTCIGEDVSCYVESVKNEHHTRSIVALANAIRTNGTLEELRVNQNGLGDAESRVICKAMTRLILRRFERPTPLRVYGLQNITQCRTVLRVLWALGWLGKTRRSTHVLAFQRLPEHLIVGILGAYF